MERFELEPELQEEIRARVLGEGFMKVVQSVRRNGETFRISMRPVEIGGVRKFQAEMVDGGRVQVKNLDANAAAEGLEEILAQRGARDLHLMTATGDLHVRVTRKGRAHVSRSAEMARAVTVQPHDRVKKTPLTSFDSAALLKAIGLADGDGRVRASMRGKYDQVNEFLKVVGETVGNGERGTGNGERGTFTVVDCGCGKAYLTVALWHYLTFTLGYSDVRVIGVDRRRDVIEAARKTAASLDLSDKVVFVEADLSSFDLSTSPLLHSSTSPLLHSSTSSVDLVVSLHACDTATDEALAKGVEWKARYILSAPCCQHELQKVLGNNRIVELSNNRMGEAAKSRSVQNGGIGDAALPMQNGRGASPMRPQRDWQSPRSESSNSRTAGLVAFAGLLRQSILRERLCDILTDSFRALILRILGFKVQVIEFVSSEATARNVMLKCEYGVKPGQPGPVGEYLNLRDFWGVTPWLETRLEALLSRHLRRYE